MLLTLCFVAFSGQNRFFFSVLKTKPERPTPMSAVKIGGDWVENTDPSTGRKYYANTVTKVGLAHKFMRVLGRIS